MRLPFMPASRWVGGKDFRRQCNLYKLYPPSIHQLYSPCLYKSSWEQKRPDPLTRHALQQLPEQFLRKFVDQE